MSGIIEENGNEISQQPIINYENKKEYLQKTEDLIQGIEKLKLDKDGYGLFRFKQDDVMLEQLTKRIELLIEDRKRAKSELEQNKSSKEVIEGEKEKINENMNQMKSDLQELKKKEKEFNDAEEKIKTMEISISELNEARTNIQQELTKAQEALVDNSGKSDEEIQKLTKQIANMNSLNEQIVSLKTSLKECESSKDECNKEKERVSNEIIGLRTQFEEQQADISRKETQIKELTEGNRILNNKIGEINSNLKSLQEEKEGLEDENLKLTTGNTQLEKVNLELRKEKAVLEAKQKAELEAKQKDQLEAQQKAQLEDEYQKIKKAIDNNTDKLKKTMENEYQPYKEVDIEKISPDEYTSKISDLAGILIKFPGNYNIRTPKEIISSSLSPTEKLEHKIGIHGETQDEIFKNRIKVDIIKDFNNGRTENEKDYSTYMESKVEEYNAVYEKVLLNLEGIQKALQEKQQQALQQQALQAAADAVTNVVEKENIVAQNSKNVFHIRIAGPGQSSPLITSFESIKKTTNPTTEQSDKIKFKKISVLIHRPITKSWKPIGIIINKESKDAGFDFNNIKLDQKSSTMNSINTILSIPKQEKLELYKIITRGKTIKIMDQGIIERSDQQTWKVRIGENYDPKENDDETTYYVIGILTEGNRLLNNLKIFHREGDESPKVHGYDLSIDELTKRESIEFNKNKSNTGQGPRQRQTQRQFLTKKPEPSEFDTIIANNKTEIDDLDYYFREQYNKKNTYPPNTNERDQRFKIANTTDLQEKIQAQKELIRILTEKKNSKKQEGGENKSHDNIMGLRNLTRKNHRGGYRYSDLGMKGLTIVLTDAAPVKKVAKKKNKNKSKKAKGKKGKSGKKMYLGKNTVRRNKGSPKKRKVKK